MKNLSTKIFVFFFEYSIFINILQRFINIVYYEKISSIHFSAIHCLRM